MSGWSSSQTPNLFTEREKNGTRVGLNIRERTHVDATLSRLVALSPFCRVAHPVCIGGLEGLCWSHFEESESGKHLTFCTCSLTYRY